VIVDPFEISIPEERLLDLRRRLVDTRWPDELDNADGRWGVRLDRLSELVAYWTDGFDWSAQERRLGLLPHFRARVGGLEIHFIHQRGRGPDPVPLILTHGWPGSFLEFEAVIPRLADPASWGGDPKDAFDVVVPSLPGFGFSQAPRQAGVSSRQVAALWAELMASLGYRRFGAQGGDIGAGVTAWLGRDFPDRLIGLHLNYTPGSYAPPADDPPPSDEERRFLASLADWAGAEGGYSHVQQTKPQTLGYALNDSPAGLAAWIVEKIDRWSDGLADGPISRDQILTNVSLYWVTQSATSSMRIYRENKLQPLAFAPGERVAPPLGYASFPKEISHPPRSWLERVFEVRQWTTMPRGGHFAAWEQPDLLVEDVRRFFRGFR
jgi:pimeloyl-ACP methyl ester carboxylesterase